MPFTDKRQTLHNSDVINARIIKQYNNLGVSGSRGITEYCALCARPLKSALQIPFHENDGLKPHLVGSRRLYHLNVMAQENCRVI